MQSLKAVFGMASGVAKYFSGPIAARSLGAPVEAKMRLANLIKNAGANLGENLMSLKNTVVRKVPQLQKLPGQKLSGPAIST